MKIFVSYNHQDQKWAEWISWKLEESGHEVIIQAWDFRAGTNFVLQMHKASSEADRVLLVLSPEFLDSGFTAAEWAAAFAKDPSGNVGFLLPVRVRPCNPVGLLGQIIYLDLVGLSQEVASASLIAAIDGARRKPQLAPQFPIEHRDIIPPHDMPQSATSPMTDGEWYRSDLPPRSPSLTQLLSVPSSAQDVRDAWQLHYTGQVTIPLGIDRHGGLVSVDLAQDGPCGFFVGSSGSGTSELLRLVCTSLALRYPPSRIRIHLLDRKGGGVWRSVQGFPHVSNVFSDWDDGPKTSQFAKSMAELAEAKRSLIRGASAGDLGEYNVLNPTRRLPLDVVLVDEFFGDDPLADMLVRLQRIGRPLGIVVIAAAASFRYLPDQFVPMARFGVYMGHYELDTLRTLPTFAFLDSTLPSLQMRSTPHIGRSLLGTSTAVIPFQAGWTGGWSPGVDDSLYPRSSALDEIGRLLGEAASTCPTP